MSLRPIPGYAGYFATPDGRIFSVRYRCHGSVKAVPVDTTPREKRFTLNRAGYAFVTVSIAGRHRTRRVHTLVALAYLGSPPAGEYLVRHLDGDKLNNAASNLAWGDARSNRQDDMRTGAHAHGERHGCAKLTRDAVRAIRTRLAAGEQGLALARAYGVSNNTISRIRLRKLWRTAC